MDDAVANARMTEFISSKGLTSEYNSYVAAYERRRAALSEPYVSVSYEKEYSRRCREDSINITPWMREAILEDMQRLARIARDEDAEPNDEDAAFLVGIVESCADEEEMNWIFRAQSVKVMIYGLADDLRKNLGEIRPDDHDLIRHDLVEAKGPMGPVEGPEAVGTLI